MPRCKKTTFPMKRGKLLSLPMLAFLPILVGCDAVTTGVATFGTVFWTDIALTPVRSLIGAAVLAFINGV